MYPRKLEDMSKMPHMRGNKVKMSLTFDPEVYYALNDARGKIPATTYCNMILQELFGVEQ